MPLITWVISIDTIKGTKSNSSSCSRILAPPIVPGFNFRAQNALSHAAHLIWSAPIKHFNHFFFRTTNSGLTLTIKRRSTTFLSGYRIYAGPIDSGSNFRAQDAFNLSGNFDRHD